MITKWKLFNFKSVRNETDLTIAPLTIFAGANSSGKSTFLQSILLVAQTLAHKVSSRSVVLNGALARLGQFDDLKTADSDADQIVIGWTCQLPREFGESPTQGFRRMPYQLMRGRAAITDVSCEVAFDAKDAESQRDIAQIQPLLFASRLSLVTRDPDAGERQDSDAGKREYHICIRRAALESEGEKMKWIAAATEEDLLARRSLKFDVEMDSASLEEVRDDFASAQPVGCIPRHFLPDRLVLGIDLVAEDVQTILSVLCGDSPRGYPRRMYVDRQIAVPPKVVERILQVAAHMGEQAESIRDGLLRRLEKQPGLSADEPIPLDQLADAMRRFHPRMRMDFHKALADDIEFKHLVRTSVRELHDGREDEPAVVPFRAPSPVSEAIRYTDQFFSVAVRYLGPLRDEPKSLYPLSPTADPSDVGLKGEHTAAVLELHKTRQVQYFPTSVFADAEIQLKPVTRSLEAAVTDWLHYLGVAEHVDSHDKGKFGHELTVRLADSKRPHDLTHVGVGVSQVLPILVMSLLADRDTTLIFEQPELHLHPMVQTRLGDFFLSIILAGKQCLIETHSEYLINRLRFRAAAEETTNRVTENLKIYFVEKKNGASGFRDVKVNEYGAILDWPEGFFDQSQSEAESILRAAAAKKKMQKGK